MKTASQVRSTFIDFFTGQGHLHVPSSALVPKNDPTLLFTTAGMVQFKDIFTGAETRASPRAVTSQKCLRAGGKHNDLENVGYTARHHTFFEMLGNFSFGDYFKDDAIAYAWRYITEELDIPKERLLVTVYAEDEEAAEIWRKVTGFSDHRILRISTSDNFWSMGDTGPCGPCSEIFYDHGDHIPGGPPGSADEDGNRFVEIWNLVFMQFDQSAGGKRVPLPKPSIDTGMGLERITAVVQGSHNNYDIDLFQTLIGTLAELLKLTPKFISQDERLMPSFRVIADHLRACSFLIADGVLPANEGRGYVLRRIMRRAMRHAHILGAKTPILSQLVPTLVAQMGEAYPELGRAQPLIEQTLKWEEHRFQDMLERGLRLLHEETTHLKAGEFLSGAVAFKLYDTFGFPLDLTQDALKAEGRSVDNEGFQQAMERQRQESRAHWTGSGEVKTNHLWFDLLDRHGATEFLGYTDVQADGKILEIIKADVPVPQAGGGDIVQILVNQTPFYGESGGQMGDAGVILTQSKARIRITDTLKVLGKLHIHMGCVEEGVVSAGDIAHFVVDGDRRQGLRNHHSVTHLLHAALRQVLGPHVTQKGSLVAPDRLRFDFSHSLPLTGEEMRSVEKIVNQEIRGNHKISTQIMVPEQAVAQGAMALFGEKYGEEVRVVSMGSPLPSESPEAVFSLELCGGTHVTRTGDIGFFHIMNESGVSAGVRRIEAIAGAAIESWLEQQATLMREMCGLLKSSPGEAPVRIRSLIEERKRQEQDIRTLRQQLLSGPGSPKKSSGSSAAPHENEGEEIIKGIPIVWRQFTDIPHQEVRALIDKIKTDMGSGVVVIANRGEDKVTLMIGVTPDLTHKLSAVPLIKAGSEVLGGSGGGGRPDLAQGGGASLQNIPSAFEAIRRLLQGVL